MSKKELVKEVIDKLIKEGNDFADLTQGALIEMEELDGVSKTTIKRAKKEYKLEKIVVKGDYKEQTIKRKIYKYLDKHPKSALSDLREALPNIPPAKVSEYHLFWKKKQQKLQKQAKKKKTTVSPRKLREMILNYLDENPNSTIENLYMSFPDANQSSLNSYFSHWKKKQRTTETGKEGGLFQVVTKFLDNNPESDIESLKDTFSDVPKKSLEVYHKIWLNKRTEQQKKTVSLHQVIQEFISPEAENKKLVKQNDVERKGANRQVQAVDSATISSQKGIGNSDNKSVVSLSDINSLKNTGEKSNHELIEILRNTIEAQQTTINALDAEYSLLKEQQTDIQAELEKMSEEEIKEVREFIATYLVGLKE